MTGLVKGNSVWS